MQAGVLSGHYVGGRFSDPMNKCRRPLKACGGLAFCKRQKNQTTVLMLNTSLADGQNVTGMGSFGL
jgi:hypothetical protein